MEGATCWRLARADRVAVLIDAAAYHIALLQAFRQAHTRIMILGWDFDPRIRLDPADAATELRRLLPALVQRNPGLHVYLLIWDVSLVFGPSRTLDQVFDEWQAHSGIHFHLDGRHPFAAAHHEKIVCVDDALAFAGGIDLTVKRWDTPEHAPADPRRTDAHDGPYGPVHDLQMGRSAARRHGWWRSWRADAGPMRSANLSSRAAPATITGRRRSRPG